MYKIDKDKPIPTISNKYPFSKMEVGDSFYISISDRAKVTAASIRYGRENNSKFMTRKENEGFRIWRIK